MARRLGTASKGVGSRTPSRPAKGSAAPDPGRAPASRSSPGARLYFGRMVMVGHSQRLAQPLTRGQQRVIAVVVAVLLAAATWAVVRPGGAPVSRNGCVSVVVASSTGGGLLHNCGAAARAWCQTEFARTDALARLIQPQCRRAGLQPRRS
jgi:hypothetical protein